MILDQPTDEKVTYQDLLDKVDALDKKLEGGAIRRITGDMIIPGAVKATHIQDAVIRRDVASKRPAKGSIACWAFLATDTGVLSIWNGTAWKTTTLS